jgi:hypothetical protein
MLSSNLTVSSESRCHSCFSMETLASSKILCVLIGVFVVGCFLGTLPLFLPPARYPMLECAIKSHDVDRDMTASSENWCHSCFSMETLAFPKTLCISIIRYCIHLSWDGALCAVSYELSHTLLHYKKS